MPNQYLFLAKSDPIETIQEHTEKLLVLFDKFKKIYGNKKYGFTEIELELIEIACKLHDLGKINSRFQNKIKKNINKKNKEKQYKLDDKFDDFYKSLDIDKNEIPHGILSSAFIDVTELEERFSDEEISILASTIYNHHNKTTNAKETDINKIINKELKYYVDFYDKNLKLDDLGINMNAILKHGISERILDKYSFWLKFIVVKGMLNKLDYAASAGLYTLEIEPNDTSEHVKKSFDKKKEIDNTIEFPNDAQKYMKEHKNKSLIIVASTGIGKTEGALLWAGDSKTFYTLPVKVSINAIYERIKDNGYYGDSDKDKQKVTFLHSDTRSMMMKDDETNYETRYIATRHLIYPLTVCTVDQLFYFVFKSIGTEKFPATLKYSKVIIDEIQSYSPDITAFIIYGLKVITDLGGQFLIMTATLPPVVKYFLIETIGKDKFSVDDDTIKIPKDNEKVIIRDNPFFKKDTNGEIIKRHFIKYIEGDFNYNEIIDKAKTKKVIIICNTVKRSQNVYKELRQYTNIEDVDIFSLNEKELNNFLKDRSKNIDINLLHSRFILKDRKIKEHCILQFAKHAKTGIWISTQIVEASLDIDFDILYTDMCTADSLLQRMGRCYRNRVYNEKTPNVFIYKNNDEKSIGVGSVYDKDIFDFSVEYIKQYDINNNIFSEENKKEYIDKVYNVDKLQSIKDKNSYYKTIKWNLETLKNIDIGVIDKNITEHQFRNINNITVIPQIFYKELEKENIFENYENATGKEKLKIKEKILSYTTAIHLSFIKYCNKIPLKYVGFGDIYTTYLKYNYQYGILNELDDELEVNDRCM